ncbi:uncharacterized protein LOC143898641 isoform X1 [Temnothorax americanus]|uniref:uncharacterized protein LOC143898641 isoform X1 n=1 Tax=Temnothorax americanus TaxID=1964332 RepID=UPI004068F137
MRIIQYLCCLINSIKTDLLTYEFLNLFLIICCFIFSRFSSQDVNVLVESTPGMFSSDQHVEVTTAENSQVFKDNCLPGSVGITASYDAGWQKKGSGRSNNSLTGHGAVFGHYSGLCIGFATQNKNCRYCSIGSKTDHDCRRNFEGSSKAMEPDMAVEIFTKNKQFDAENVYLKTLIGDEDSCTIASVRRELGRQVIKWTDLNHATKKLAKFLYPLKKMSSTTVEYFRYVFRCVLQTNKKKVEATKESILNIVPHAFGNHEKCGSWCGYNVDPVNFKHKILPNGKPLTGDELKTSVTSIFQQFANDADKLASCGSSQLNENCNIIIASKAPKARHYGSSSD